MNTVCFNHVYLTSKKKQIIPQDYLCTVFSWGYENGIDLDLKLSVVTGLTDNQSENFGYTFNEGSGYYGTYNTDDTGPSEQGEIAKEILSFNKERMYYLATQLQQSEIKIIVRAHWNTTCRNGEFNFRFADSKHPGLQPILCYSSINLGETTNQDYTLIGNIYYNPFTDTYRLQKTPDFTIQPNTTNITNITIIKNQQSTTDNNIQLQYRLGNSTTWMPYTIGTIIQLNKSNAETSSIAFSNLCGIFSNETCIYQLSSTNQINVYGKLYSLILENQCYTNNYKYAFQSFFENCPVINSNNLLLKNCNIGTYKSLFKNCTSLINSPDLSDIKELYQNCYQNMFINCKSLTSEITLLAESLSENCYQSMFEGCSSITTIKKLTCPDAPASSHMNMFKNCTSLTSEINLSTETLFQNCYQSMFEGCSSITTIKTLFTDIDNAACKNMFKDCSALTSQITLLATELEPNCYWSMFENCSSITTINNLGFTDTAVSCCRNMFKNCISLTSNINLPAEILDNNCYQSMFENCTSITTINNLGFTDNAASCCLSMFKNCTSLTSNIKLLPEDLTNNCYQSMFENCSKLNSVTVSFYRWLEEYNTTLNWLKDVATNGTFYYTDGDLPLSTGVSYIPVGWTVIKVQE